MDETSFYFVDEIGEPELYKLSIEERAALLPVPTDDIRQSMMLIVSIWVT